MSKITKLIKHPILFFVDMKKKAKKIRKNILPLNEVSIANISLIEYEIAVYFSGSMGNKYQLEQWLKTFSILEKEKRLLFIVRIKSVYNWLRVNTDFVVVYCKTFSDLNSVYEVNNFKCILYVNQAVKNFQSLAVRDALHVHINHGESDKTSTISNQSKAYDYIFIVSDAAYDKYNLNLIKKDMHKFIQIGRPQLDYISKVDPLYNTVEQKVILYAPTWEGTHESMNFTSIDDFGLMLVEELIQNDEYYIVYKPHPNTGSRLQSTKTINKTIKELIATHENGIVIESGDINSLYEYVDLAIFDNSAVAIDYLKVDKPMIMTDLFYRIIDRKSKPIITSATRMLEIDDIEKISYIIKDEINNDTLKHVRTKVKKYFLGEYDYSHGESTQKFISVINAICQERDILLEKLITQNKEVQIDVT